MGPTDQPCEGGFIMEKVKENIMLFIWGITLIAVFGSIFFSEILGFTPCEYCWYQRVLMYPLVIIYGTAILKNNISIALPGLILRGIGFCVSTYHYLVQKLPAFQEVGGSCGDLPCHLQYVNYFGFITIPFLAGISFLIIFVTHLIVLRLERRK